MTLNAFSDDNAIVTHEVGAHNYSLALLAGDLSPATGTPIARKLLTRLMLIVQFYSIVTYRPKPCRP
jgi:hypothetical protein